MEKQAAKKQNVWTSFLAAWKKNPLISTACVLVLMVILQTIALGFDYDTVGEWFARWGKNWINILRNNAGVGIIALGMTFVIISGGIDLAVGSTMVAIGAIIMVLVDQNPGGVLTAMGITGVPAFVIAIAAALIAGSLLGSVSGALIAKSKIPPFIATLGTQMVTLGLGSIITNVKTQRFPTITRQ